MRPVFVRLFKESAGITAIEYGLIAALIALVMFGAAATLGTKLSTFFSKLAASV